jgi:hypothetical protein
MVAVAADVKAVIITWGIDLKNTGEKNNRR